MYKTSYIRSLLDTHTLYARTLLNCPVPFNRVRDLIQILPGSKLRQTLSLSVLQTLPWL